MIIASHRGKLAALALCITALAPTSESWSLTVDDVKDAFAANSDAYNAILGIMTVGSPTQAHITNKPVKGFPLDGASYLIISSGDAANVVPGVGSGNGNTSTGPCVSDAQFQTLCNVGGLNIDLAIPLGAQTLEFDYLFFEWDYIPFEDPFRVFVTALGQTTMVAQSSSSCDLGYYKGDAQFAFGLLRRHVVIDLLTYGGLTITLRLQASDRYDNLLNSGALVDKLVIGPASGEEMNISCPGLDPDDTDQDNIPDSADNCPDVPNTNQSDNDEDGDGDLCDLDDDNDDVNDITDNCPNIPNPLQNDLDNNGVGDACEPNVTPKVCVQPPGDVNEDAKTDVGDVQCTILVSLWSLGQIPGTPPDCAMPSVAVTDMNCSGATDVQDLQISILLVLEAPLDASIDFDQDLCPDTCEP